MKLGMTVLALAAWGMMATAADNAIIKNANWSELNPKGIPAHWENRARTPNTAVVTPAATGNVLKLTVKDPKKPTFLMYRQLGLEAGENYVVSYEVKGSAGNKYLAYCEWTFQPANAPKPNLRGINTSMKTATADWQKCSFSFKYPADCKNAYCVLMARAGELEFRNLSIKLAD